MGESPMFGLRILAAGRDGRIARAALGAVALGGIALGLAPRAKADIELHYPIIDYREFELEHNGETTFDKPGSGKSNNQSYTVELGYAPFTWWEPEIEFDM